VTRFKRRFLLNTSNFFSFEKECRFGWIVSSNLRRIKRGEDAVWYEERYPVIDCGSTHAFSESTEEPYRSFVESYCLHLGSGVFVVYMVAF